MKRYVNPVRESKSAVRSIKRTLLRRKPRNRKAEPEYAWRRQQAARRAWNCSVVLPRRMDDGMLVQYLQELGRPCSILKPPIYRALTGASGKEVIRPIRLSRSGWKCVTGSRMRP